MKNVLRILISGLLIASPLMVWWFAQNGLTNWLLLALITLLSLSIVAQGIGHPRSWLSMAVLLVVSVTAIFADQLTGVLFYPVWMNAALLLVFVGSLWRKPSVITRLATLMEGSLSEKAVAYTEKVTMVWVVFFLMNGAIALATAVHGDIELDAIQRFYILRADWVTFCG